MSKDHKQKKWRFFKIPQNKYTLRANVYLAIGFVFVIFGAIFLAASFADSEKISAMRPFVALCLGAVFLFFSVAFTESGAFMFVGLSSIVFGILSLLIDFSLTSLTFKELWPIDVIGCGVALIPSGLYTQRRIRSIYLLPALALIFLGTIFLLFSLRVIKVSFTVFVGTWWPVLLILGGLALIAVFLVQQSHHRILPYMEDDSLLDGEDS